LGLSNEQIVDRVRAFAPDLIGLTIPFSCQHYVAHAVAQCLKQEFPNVILVAGGNHVTAAPEQIDRRHIDYLILGEGEQALTLIDALNRNRSVTASRAFTRAAATYRCAPSSRRWTSYPFRPLTASAEQLWQTGKRWINMIATRGRVYDCSLPIHTIMDTCAAAASKTLSQRSSTGTGLTRYGNLLEDDNLTVNCAWAKRFSRPGRAPLQHPLHGAQRSAGRFDRSGMLTS
jgi:hypothetical protein